MINSIQQGMASSLNFGAIVELVGDKLRELFKSGNLGIAWNEPDSASYRWIYAYEHGQRLDIPPMRLTPKHTSRASAQVLNTRQDFIDAGQVTVAGTDPCLSLLSVQIIGGDRVLGRVKLEDHERENAYGPADVRLLETIASSMGMALPERAPV